MSVHICVLVEFSKFRPYLLVDVLEHIEPFYSNKLSSTIRNSTSMGIISVLIYMKVLWGSEILAFYFPFN